MNLEVRRCLDLHLVDKAKPGTAVSADAWFAAARQHLDSTAAIINADPNGAVLLAWACMHKTAKGLAALVGHRLHDETHGKMVDFLLCVFGPVLEEREAGVIRLIQQGRNMASYDQPMAFSGRLTAEAFNVALRLLNVAQARL